MRFSFKFNLLPCCGVLFLRFILSLGSTREHISRKQIKCQARSLPGRGGGHILGRKSWTSLALLARRQWFIGLLKGCAEFIKLFILRSLSGLSGLRCFFRGVKVVFYGKLDRVFTGFIFFYKGFFSLFNFDKVVVNSFFLLKLLNNYLTLKSRDVSFF